MAPLAAEDVRAAMGEEELQAWQRAARGDEAALVEEGRRQGPVGYLDDNIANALDWGCAVEGVRVPTKLMAARDDSDAMKASSRWLAARIPGAELLWRAGGHLDSRDDAEIRLFHWLGHGALPGRGASAQ